MYLFSRMNVMLDSIVLTQTSCKERKAKGKIQNEKSLAHSVIQTGNLEIHSQTLSQPS